MTGSGHALRLGVMIFVALCSSVYAGGCPTLNCQNGGLFYDNGRGPCSCICVPGTTGYLCEKFACPPGWVWILEARMCMPCNIASKPSGTGASARCVSCPAGETTLNIGAKECVPIGVWGQWMTGACSVTCGDGVQVRTRQCNYPSSAAQHVDCKGSAIQVVPCNEEDCSALSVLNIVLVVVIIIIVVILIPGGCIIICIRLRVPAPRPVPYPYPRGR